MNIWCEFEEDPLKINGCREQTRKTTLAPSDQKKPQYAKKLIGIWTLLQGVNLKKVHYKLNSLQHTQERQSWPPRGHKCNQ